MTSKDHIDMLAESVEIERRSDLFAASCNLREAAALMREANRIRASVFGKREPNELRELTHAVVFGLEPIIPLSEREIEMLRDASTTGGDALKARSQLHGGDDG